MSDETPVPELSPIQRAQLAKAEAEREIAQIEVDLLRPLLNSVFEGTELAGIIAKVKQVREQLVEGFVFNQLGHFLTVTACMPNDITHRLGEIGAILNPIPAPNPVLVAGEAQSQSEA
jgi:hypothetical protein